MQAGPTVSVIIPVFNAAQYLPLIIDSVKSQTFTDFEALFVDDGSTDDSADIVRDFALHDQRVKLLQQPNGGLSAARNLALDNALGGWIVFLDGDDWLRPDALQVWLSAAEGRDVDVVIANGFRFKGTPDVLAEARILDNQPWGKSLSGPEWIVQAVAARNWKHYVWLQMIRRDFIETNRLRFIPRMVHEDIAWTCDLGLAASSIAFVDELIYGYRVNFQSLTGSGDQKRIQARAAGYVTAIETLVDRAERHEKPEVRAALLRHGIVECGHLMGLFRKRLEPSTVTLEMAGRLLNGSELRLLTKAARSPDELWRMFKFKSTLKKFMSRL